MSTNKYGLDRTIPSPVKRLVRQRCGYGCVVCGGLFCEYHHFDPPFPEAKKHIADGITLLCTKHHSDITAGRISDDLITQSNAHPYSLQKGNPHYLFEDLQYPFEVALGAIVFITPTGILLEADGKELLSIKNTNSEPPMINASFSSGKRETLEIVENEVVVNKGSWDIETKKSEVIVRSNKREIFLHLVFTPPKRLQIVKIKNVFNGHIIDSEFGGKLYIKSASGANIDFASGYIATGGKITLDRQKGITIDRGCLVMGSIFPHAFKGDLDYLFGEVRKLEELGVFHD